MPMHDEWKPPLPKPDGFHMGTARQMALDALRTWQEQMTMPGTADA